MFSGMDATSPIAVAPWYWRLAVYLVRNRYRGGWRLFAIGASLRSFWTAGAFARCLRSAHLRPAARPGAGARSAFLWNLQAVLPGRADAAARRATRADAIAVLLLAARGGAARGVRRAGRGAAGGSRSAARHRPVDSFSSAVPMAGLA